MESEMKKIAVRGDMRGRHYLNPMCIESMVLVPKSPRGTSAVSITTMSGREFFVDFDSEDDAKAYLDDWVMA